MSHPLTLHDRLPKHYFDPPAPCPPAIRSKAAAADDKRPPSAAIEFEAAMAEYKRRSGRRFPTWSEVLEVLRGLGYAKPGDQAAPRPEAIFTRHRVRISRNGPEGRSIAANLSRHGGVCVDSGSACIYEFPSEAAYDAALMAVRSAYGWTSVEPRY
jgi:hypothetical protein